MKKTVLVLAIAAMSSGCSLMFGPAPTARLYDPTVEKLTAKANEDWTNFQTLDDARTRLAGMSQLLQESARRKEVVRLGSGDVAALGGITSVIAAATGDTGTAAWGAGVAGLLGLGDQRLQLAVQRANMVNAAKAFQCVRDAIHGVEQRDLDIEFKQDPNATPEQKQALAKLNESRYDVVRMVASAAYDIRGAMEEAQARVEVRQPNLEQIRQGLSQEQGQPKAGQPGKPGAGGTMTFSFLGSPDLLAELPGKPTQVTTENMIEVLRGLDQLKQKDAAAEYLLNEWIAETKSATPAPADKAAMLATYEARAKTLAERQKNMQTLTDDVKNFVAAALLDSPIGSARSRFIENRIRALPDRLQVCRGLVSAS